VSITEDDNEDECEMMMQPIILHGWECQDYQGKKRTAEISRPQNNPRHQSFNMKTVLLCEVVFGQVKRMPAALQGRYEGKRKKEQHDHSNR